jgi:beta-lactamase regulating signal transducer with metallopeptidase domain
MSLTVPATWLCSLASAGVLHRLGWVVLHSLWQGVAVAVVLAVALRFVPKRSVFGQEARYLLATLALFSLPVACGVSWALVEPSRSAMAWEAGREKAYTFTFVFSNPPATAADRTSAPPTASEALAALATHAATAAEPWLPLCAAGWLAGVFAAAMRLAIGWSLTRRLVATAASVNDARWQARLTRWQSALGIDSPIRLVMSTRVDVPIVVGWLRPVVIWPAAAVFGMPPEQIDAILAHELAHVRRHDVLVNFLQSVIEAVFFHHPAVWWISAQVRAEREHCADELAIRALAAGRAGSRISYATALLGLEERRQAILAAAANGGSLGDRIRRLAGIEQTSGHPARLAAAVLVLAAIVAGEVTVVPNGPRAEAGQSDLAASPTAEQKSAAVKPGAGLDPEQARGLVAMHNNQPHPSNAMLVLDHVTTLDAATARVLAEFKGQHLRLRGLTALDTDAATALAAYRCQTEGSRMTPSQEIAQLFLGLTSLDAETARSLSDFKGYGLHLFRLKTLDADTANALAACGCQSLSLDGLATLDADTAKALAACKVTVLSFRGLKTLDADVANAFSEFKGDLCFDGLVSVDAATAKALAAFKGTSLNLAGLTTLDTASARELVESTAWNHSMPKLVSIDAETVGALLPVLKEVSLKTLDAKTARALARAPRWDGDLSGLTTLDAEAAKAIAEFKGDSLLLDGLKSIDAPTAMALAGFKGRLRLTGLKTLDADTARALAGCAPWDGCLYNVSAFEGVDSVEVAAALATRKQPLNLLSLKKVSPKTLTALLENGHVVIPPIEKLELIQEPDGSPTDDFVIPEDFEARQKAARNNVPPKAEQP